MVQARVCVAAFWVLVESGENGNGRVGRLGPVNRNTGILPQFQIDCSLILEFGHISLF